MRRLVPILLLLTQLTFAAPKPKVILAVFAHPDDESMVGPVLARYAKQGVDVYIAYATDGQRGARDFAGIPAGEQLGRARRAEASCASQKLGAKPPTFFGLMDGDLGAMTSPLGKNIQATADQVQKLIDELHPDAIITWGPEGGYGHPDHRLVSDAVTQVVQQSSQKLRLFYVGLDRDGLKQGKSGFGEEFMGTDPQYLTVRVRFSPQDLEAATRALQCHDTQMRPEDMKKDMEFLAHAWNGQIPFRPWFGTEKSDSVLNP
jgi:LmbE family N-acetylglucosaminyl deacetylase